MLTFEAAYFGDEGDKPLFGLFQPSLASAASEEAVLVCYPLPQEMMRSYWAHRQMSLELARGGLANFRFDYFATGDSRGSSQAIDLRRWQADIRAAFRHLKIASRSPRISVVGTRLGALLAVHALAELNVHRFLLWDAVVSGGHYLLELERSHQEMVAALFQGHLNSAKLRAEEELLGFPFPALVKNQLAELSWRWPEKAKEIHFVSSDLPSEEVLRLRLGMLDADDRIHFHRGGASMLWQDPMALKTQAFPQGVLQLIQGVLGRRSR